MKHASRWLPVALLFVALTAFGQPAAADPDDDEYPIDDWADDAGAGQDDAPKPAKTPAPRTTKAKGANDLTDDQAAALGFGSLCCCLIGVLAMVALIVWAVRRSSKPVPPSPAAGTIQLSIFALGLEPQARAVVEQQLAQLRISSVPTSPETRGLLVREAARALLTVQPSWKQFGYGEKPGLPDLGSAEVSYRAASDDFRARAQSVGATASPDSGLVLVTLLICSRRGLLGVSRLDDPLQVRNVLEDRMRVGDADLLGAELLWAPATPGGTVSQAEVGLRFPEMLPLSRAAI